MDLFKCVVDKPYENVQLIKTDQTKESLLEGYATSGVFTTIRTIGNKQIVEYQSHLARLVSSWNALAKSSNSKLEDLSSSVIDHGLRRLFGALLVTLDESHDHSLTVILGTKDLDRLHLLGFAIPIPKYPEAVQVETREAVRINPDIKSTQWVIDRRNLEILHPRKPETHELLLITAKDKLVLEGLSSNFAVIDDRLRLYTAPEGLVLAGTMRKLVLECWSGSMGLEVIMEAPSLLAINTWRIPFIMSTTRLVLPIHTIIFDGHCQKFNPDAHFRNHLARLTNLLAKQLLSRAVSFAPNDLVSLSTNALGS